MKKLSINLFCLIFFVASQLLAQQFSPGSPEWLVDMFFSKSSFPEKANYFSGEMLDEISLPTIGEELKGKSDIYFRQIKAGNNEIAFAVELKSENKIIDFYCYLKKSEETWKLDAVRRFMLPPFLFQLLDSLSKLDSPTDNDQELLRTLELFTANDSLLKNFISTNINSLNNLIWNFNQGENEKVSVQLKSIGCSAVFKDKKYPGCTFIQINSIDRMEAGFIYALSGSVLPPISPEGFIYIEEVLPRWFIYRIM